MAVALFFTAIPLQTIVSAVDFKAGTEVYTKIETAYTGYGGVTYSDKRDYKYMLYTGANGTSIKGSIIKLNKNSSTGDIAYCIEVRTHAPDTGTETTYEGKDWKTYTSLQLSQRDYINYAIMYGYLGTQKYSSYGSTANDERIK